MIDASVIVSAAISASNVLRNALTTAVSSGQIALSPAVFAEVSGVLMRPKFAKLIPSNQRNEILDILVSAAIWLQPDLDNAVTDCRDAKDNIYLELALTADASAIVSGRQ